MAHLWRMSLMLLMLPNVCQALVPGKPTAKRASVANIPTAAEKTPEAPEAVKGEESSDAHVDVEERAAERPSIVEAASDAFNQFQKFLQWQQQAKDFEEFLQHRTEFFAWRRSNNQQPKKFHDDISSKAEKLFPVARHSGKALLSYIITADHGDAVPLESSQVELTADPPDALDENVLHVESATNSTLAHQTDPRGFVRRGIEETGMGDWFLISGILLMVCLYCVAGFWGVFGYLWFQTEHFICIMWHLYDGTPIPRPEHKFHKLEVEKDRDIAVHGIARPGSLLFKTKWEKLTPGQKYVFDLFSLDDKTWDKAVEHCIQKPGYAFCDVIGIGDWDSFTKAKKKLLKQVGVHRETWSQEDPAMLPIKYKTWADLSEFEQFMAGQLGIRGDRNPDEWDRRRAKIFKTYWDEMTPDQQTKLRKIGFVRKNWTPYSDPIPPTLTSTIEDSIAQFWRNVFYDIAHSFLIFWVFINVCWLWVLLWRVRVIHSLWQQFAIYFIIGGVGVVLFILVCHWMQPIFKFLRDHIVAEVRICIGHVKDTWRLVARLCQHLCQHCEHCCPHSSHGGCILTPICGAAHACRGGSKSQEQRKGTTCLQCFPCLCGAHQESHADSRQT